MTPHHLYAAGIVLVISASACNNSGTTSTPPAGDSTVTTTTTTMVHRQYKGAFRPQPSARYVDLRTNKAISVRIDTTLGGIVNDETSQPVDLFVDTVTHDTISGLTGSVVNNYVIHDPGGNMRIDTMQLNQSQASAITTPDMDASGKVKYKEKNNGKIKYKDDQEKVKEKNGVQITTVK